MIIYGRRTRQLKTQIVNAVCTACGHKEQVLVGLQGYLHVYWIPLIPLPKTLAAVCTKCKVVSDEKQFPDSLNAIVPTFRASLSTPPWTFAGLVLIAAGVAFGFWSESKTRADVAASLKHPHVGDVYVLHSDPPADGQLPYTYARVLEVDATSVTLAPARYQYSAEKGILEAEIAKRESYFDTSFAVDLTALDDHLVEKVYHDAAPHDGAKAIPKAGHDGAEKQTINYAPTHPKHPKKLPEGRH